MWRMYIDSIQHINKQIISDVNKFVMVHDKTVIRNQNLTE